MYPELFKIGPFTVYSYGLMLVAAFLVSSALAKAQAKKEKIDPDSTFNLLFTVFISGIIGARLFYIVENINYYITNPAEIIMMQHGGLSWFGGLICGVLSGGIYSKRRNLPIYKVLDLVAPFVALGQSIGRIGCLLNGCCFGRITDFGVYFPVHRSVLIPTQAYSSLAMVFIFIFLRFLQERPHREGRIFFTYLLLYSLKRFLIEFWRADNARIFLGLSLFQLISAGIFFLSAGNLISIAKIKK